MIDYLNQIKERIQNRKEIRIVVISGRRIGMSELGAQFMKWSQPR